MEFIYQDGISHSFFTAVTDLIEMKIGAEEVETIKDNRFILALSESPGTVISNFCFPQSDNQVPNHLIIVDKVIFRYCQFDINEQAATILHEIGHVLNNTIDSTQKEFFADYYVKRFGFGRFLASSLEKYLNANLPYLTSEQRQEITTRIDLIRDPNQEALIGTVKELRYPNA